MLLHAGGLQNRWQQMGSFRWNWHSHWFPLFFFLLYLNKSSLINRLCYSSSQHAHISWLPLSVQRLFLFQVLVVFWGVFFEVLKLCILGKLWCDCGSHPGNVKGQEKPNGSELCLSWPRIWLKTVCVSRMIQLCASLVCHLQLQEMCQLKLLTVVVQNKLTRSYSFCLLSVSYCLTKSTAQLFLCGLNLVSLTIVTRWILYIP